MLMLHLVDLPPYPCGIRPFFGDYHVAYSFSAFGPFFGDYHAIILCD